jgi:AAA domain
MSILAKVTNTAPNLPSPVVLYAAEKWGKSSFAAYAPRPIFLMTAGETGLLSLIEARKVPAVDHFPDDFQSWQGLVHAVRALRDEKHDFQTLVLDTGNGAENLASDAVCFDKFGGDWSNFNAYGRGIDLTVPEWAKFPRFTRRPAHPEADGDLVPPPRESKDVQRPRRQAMGPVAAGGPGEAVGPHPQVERLHPVRGLAGDGVEGREGNRGGTVPAEWYERGGGRGESVRTARHDQGPGPGPGTCGGRSPRR